MKTEMMPYSLVAPGEILKQYLEAVGWTQLDLAEVLCVSPKVVNYLVSGKSAITPEIAVLLGRAFNNTAEFWMNAQTCYDLWKEKTANISKVELTEMKAAMHRIMPVAEIRKKGWFLSDVSTVYGIRSEYVRLFGQDSIPDDFETSLNQFCARQTRYDKVFSNRYCKVWYLFANYHAKKLILPAYKRDSLECIARSFAEYTSMENGVDQVIQDLKSAGVGFFVLKHLEKTYLDGATFVVDEHPMIVFTGRYDRIDNFWFVLAHEIAHILEHSHLLETPVFDNLHADSCQEIEMEADDLAGEMLHKSKICEIGKRFGKYLSVDRLNQICREARVSLPVALGILQHEGIVEWRQFSKYKKTVMDLIPRSLLMG